MDYPDYSQSQSSQRVWPPHLLTLPSQQSQSSQQQHQQQPVPFPSPVSPAGPYLFPAQSQQQQPGVPQTSPTTDPRPTTSGLSLNLSGLSVASPPSLSPIGPHQAQPGQFHPHQLHAHHSHSHHSHSHSTGSSISPITPVSPPNMPLLSPQPQFSFGFDDASGGLSPAPDPILSQRRPSTGSHSASSSELAVEKSVPRKRSLTNAHPVAPSTATVAHSMHQHSHSHSYSSSQTGQAGQHALPHPIITTTASSPPLPTSPTSPPSSHPTHSHSRSLSHSHSHSSLSHTSLSQLHSPQRPHPQLEINPNPTSPYDEIDSAGPSFGGLGDDGSDDDFGSPSGSLSASGTFGNANSKASGSSGQQGQNLMGKSVGTNNFVTKLYHSMINDAKSQHFITWTELGTSFVVTNVSEFSRSILGSHFKHNNFSSFVRQLNMYGFHKINRTPRAQRTSSSSQSWEFSHPKFLRGRPDLLEVIKRKALEPDPRERNRVELPGEVARLLSELRDENRALWREIRSLGSRIPQPAANHGQGTISATFDGSSQGSQSQISPNAQVGLGGGHVLTHSRSSSNLGGDDGERDGIAMGLGGGQGGEEWDAQSSRFNLWAGGGLNVPGFAFNAFGTAPGGEEWKRWAEGEIIKERKRVERLVGVIKALVDVTGKGGANAGPASSSAAVGMSIDREPDGIPPSILQELHELSLSFDASPSPMSMPMPSPSPSPSPHLFTRHQYSPNIFITSPTSPSPYPGSHSRSPSRESQTHSNPNTHTTLPILSIPNSIAANPSQFPQSLHTPSSSPTTSDFVPGFFRQGAGHARGGRLPRQPNITLTLETDENGRMEKRARTESDKVKDGPDAGLRAGEEMDIVPSETGEDAKLPSPMSLTGGSSPTTGVGLGGNKVMGLRSRSDSAPMWGGEGSPVQGGLSANWLGRGRNGNSFGP
ncbi:HSF-type DNA-binding-domain-containing protein [Lanmaoa asiatica]|nr:HSF-type DNA-binding-domain-containing protein [Lanmaoa asiatica]